MDLRTMFEGVLEAEQADMRNWAARICAVIASRVYPRKGRKPQIRQIYNNLCGKSDRSSEASSIRERFAYMLEESKERVRREREAKGNGGQ